MPVCPLRGSGRSQEALHHRPWPGADDRDVTRLWGSCWAPRGRVLGICSLAPHLGSRLPVQPQARPSQAWVCSVRAAQLVGWTLTGHKPGAPSCPALPTCLRIWLRTLPQEMGLCSCLCSCLVSSGQAGEGRAPQEGHLSLPPGRGSQHASWDLGKCGIR